MSANRAWLVAILTGLWLLVSPSSVVADPCCIVVVPPVIPPSPTPDAAPPPPHGQIYSQLPLFAGKERGTFGALKVDIARLPLNEGIAMVTSTQGALGLATLNALAVHKAKTGADLEITAVMISRPDYALYSSEGGPSTVGHLKGKQVAIPSRGSLAHLFTIEVLRTVGLSEKDVNFLTGPSDAMTMLVLGGKADAAPLFVGAELAQPKLKQIPLPKPIRLPSWTLYASSGTLDKDTREVAQLVKGLIDGIRIVKKDSELTRRILAQQFNITDRKAQDFIVDKYIPFLLPDTVKPDPKEIEYTMDMLRSIGQFEKPPILFNAKRLGQFY